MRSVSPACGRIWSVTAWLRAVLAALTSAAIAIPNRENRMARLETVRVVSGRRANGGRHRPLRLLRRYHRAQLRLEELPDVGGPLAQCRVARANHILILTNTDRVLHPSEREGRIQRAKTAQHGGVEID